MCKDVVEHQSVDTENANSIIFWIGTTSICSTVCSPIQYICILFCVSATTESEGLIIIIVCVIHNTLFGCVPTAANLKISFGAN